MSSTPQPLFPLSVCLSRQTPLLNLAYSILSYPNPFTSYSPPQLCSGCTNPFPLGTVMTFFTPARGKGMMELSLAVASHSHSQHFHSAFSLLGFRSVESEPNSDMLQQTSQEELYRRLHDIEQKMQYIERREQEGWRLAQQQIASIADSTRSATIIVGNLELKLSKDVNFIEESVAKEIAQEVQRRAEGEQRLRQQITEEANLVKITVEQQERQRNAEVEAKITALTASVSRLVSDMEQKIGSATAELIRAADTAKRDATRVEDMLASHKATREAAELNVLQVLEETCVQLHQQIVAERNERLESHKRLERLLLEVSRRQWVRT